MTVRASLHLCLLCVILTVCTACGGEAAKREEGRQLVEALTRLQDVDTLAERQAQLDALAKVPLAAAENLRVRDLCVTAHRQLLKAEIEQAGAKRAMEAALPKGGGQELPAAARDEISAAIGRSDAALAESKKTFPECQRGLQGLVAALR
jgi:hypothetical protein